MHASATQMHAAMDGPGSNRPQRLASQSMVSLFVHNVVQSGHNSYSNQEKSIIYAHQYGLPAWQWPWPFQGQVTPLYQKLYDQGNAVMKTKAHILNAWSAIACHITIAKQPQYGLNAGQLTY